MNERWAGVTPVETFDADVGGDAEDVVDDDDDRLILFSLFLSLFFLRASQRSCLLIPLYLSLIFFCFFNGGDNNESLLFDRERF